MLHFPELVQQSNGYRSGKQHVCKIGRVGAIPPKVICSEAKPDQQHPNSNEACVMADCHSSLLAPGPGIGHAYHLLHERVIAVYVAALNIARKKCITAQ
jgi:hypothetical protein